MSSSTMPTDIPPSCGRNDQARNTVTEEKVEDAMDAKKPINTCITKMACQSKGTKFKKAIRKDSPSDGGKRHRIGPLVDYNHIGLNKRRRIELNKRKRIKLGKQRKTVCQLEDKEFKLKKISNDSSSIGSETINADSPTGKEAIALGCKLAPRDLKSVSLLGKGLSGIAYETLCKEVLRCRKDFVHVKGDVFEQEAEVLVRLKAHANVVQTIGYAVAKICSSLVVELMDCSLRSLAQRKMLLRWVTNSGPPPEDVTATSKLDSAKWNSNSRSPQQEIKKKVNNSNSPAMSASSSKAQTSSPFSMQEEIQIITAIAAGMSHLHDNKVVHGDLKPGNILVTLKKSSGSSNFDESLAIEAVKLVDFGVVKSKSMSRCMASVSSETRKMDKIRYTAPELFDIINHGLKQDIASSKQEFDVLARGDVYSFGMTAFEILTGKEPFSDVPNSLWETLRDDVKKGRRPKLPDQCLQLKELIQMCWDGEPTKRPDFYHIMKKLKKIQVAPNEGCHLTNEKSRDAMSRTSHVLETSSTEGLNDRFNHVDHSFMKHSMTMSPTSHC